MKLHLKISGIVLAVVISLLSFPQQASAQQTQITFQVFYDQLSPYGQWVNYSDYGYIWIPDAESDFVPYSTNGHWVLSNYGWAWVSEYAWGWAPFHYGRWNFDNEIGWFWVPDTEWGPSWVTWRSSYGYYGWSPMGSRVNVDNQYNTRDDHWIFVRDRDIEQVNINHYSVDRSEYDRIMRKSAVINTTYTDKKRHITYVAGPRRTDVQKITNKRINPVAIRENDKPGQQLNREELRIYRPKVSHDNGAERKSVPNKVTPWQEKRRIPTDNRTNQSDNRTAPANSRNNMPQDNKEQPGKLQIQEPASPMRPQNINQNQPSYRPQQQNREQLQHNNIIVPPLKTIQPANINSQRQPMQPQNDNQPQNTKDVQSRPLKQIQNIENVDTKAQQSTEKSK